MSSPQLYFLDCDGVIFDANAAKAAAFRGALAPYPAELVERMVAYHQAHGGISRYAKLRKFFTEWCPVPDLDAAMQAALTRFSEVAKAEYEALSPVPEALAFAARAGAERVYVVSGADEEELRGIFDRKGIRRRFAEVHGSPATKREHFERILAARALSPRDALFVGDGRGDLEAARALDMPFIFLAAMSDWEDRAEHLRGVEVIETWPELLARLAF